VGKSRRCAHGVRRTSRVARLAPRPLPCGRLLRHIGRSCRHASDAARPSRARGRKVPSGLRHANYDDCLKRRAAKENTISAFRAREVRIASEGIISPRKIPWGWPAGSMSMGLPPATPSTSVTRLGCVRIRAAATARFITCSASSE